MTYNEAEIIFSKKMLLGHCPGSVYILENIGYSRPIQQHISINTRSMYQYACISKRYKLEALFYPSVQANKSPYKIYK